MADLIPFPRLYPFRGLLPARSIAEVTQRQSLLDWHRNPCANGMPGHPPCRSPAELEALLRTSADTTAAKEGV